MFIYILIVIAGVPLSLKSGVGFWKARGQLGSLIWILELIYFNILTRPLDIFTLYSTGWFFFFNQKKRNKRVFAPASVAYTNHVLVPPPTSWGSQTPWIFNSVAIKSSILGGVIFPPQKRQNSAHSHVRIGSLILGSFFNLYTLRVLHQCDGNDRGRVWLTGPLRIKWYHISRALNAA